MLKNYIKIAFRVLSREKLYSAINILGLAVGMAICLLIFLYVQHNFSFDNYHENRDRIYRVTNFRASSFGESWSGSTQGDPVPELRDSYTDVEDAASLMRCGSGNIVMDDVVYRDIDIECSESNLFNIFSFEVVMGDPLTMLDRPETAVITRSLSEKMFGEENPIGKLVPVAWEHDPERGRRTRYFEITGLIEDLPANTHFDADLFLSFETLREFRHICIYCGGQSAYLLLSDHGRPDEIAARLLPLIRDVQGRESVAEVRLEPLREVHFSDILAEKQGDMRYLSILTGISLIILLIACANYVNLATARFLRRTREVGIRKAAGAFRNQIRSQFLVETALQTFLALPIAIILIETILPLFNRLAGSELSVAWFSNGFFILAGIGLLFTITLLAGSYPAFFLSAFKPVSALRSQMQRGSLAGRLQHALVILQFAVSVAMIAGIFVIWQQLRHIQNAELGFDYDQIVTVPLTDPALGMQPEVVRQEFLQLSGVTSATVGRGVPGQLSFGGGWTLFSRGDLDNEGIPYILTSIDPYFLETMGVSLIAGRNIALEDQRQAVPHPDMEDFNTSFEALVNETAVREFGFEDPEEVLGLGVGFGRVVGVVEDFHFKSLHHDIEPMAMQHGQPGEFIMLTMRLAGGEIAPALSQMEETWRGLGTPMPFEFSFLSDELNQLYAEEQRTAQIVGLFASLATLLACLGLFGLATLSAHQRTKEIGVRKVLGASVLHITLLLNRDFLKLVAIGFIITIPVIWYLTNRWLENFASRIEIGPGIYLTTGFSVLIISLLIVSWQSVRAAVANPVDSLRSE